MEKRRKVGRHEVYERTHKKKKGQGDFVTDKSKDVYVSTILIIIICKGDHGIVDFAFLFMLLQFFYFSIHHFMKQFAAWLLSLVDCCDVDLGLRVVLALF